MEEYEYSSKVLAIEPYLEYCEKNKYEHKGNYFQNRVVYENEHNTHIIARLTTEIKDNQTTIIFDCKNIGQFDEKLKVSMESIPLEVSLSDKEKIESILKVINFKEAANLNRTRYIYEKANVKFEIDEYTSPKMCVVAVEGKKSEVDRVWNKINLEIGNTIANEDSER